MKKSILKIAGLAALLAMVLAQNLAASEDEPRRPFAQWADLPEPGQLIFGAFYEQSEAYHLWEGNDRMPVNYRTGGENYGIDVRQGYFTFDYGIAKNWAADLNVGATTVGWRALNPDGSIGRTTGLMDSTFGVRYQIFNETNNDTGWPWLPTLTFRAGAVVPGAYDRHVAFAPGNHGVAIEPSLLLRQHLGWPGFGLWGDVLYRWEHTIGADQYIVAAGFFQQIKGWELDAGYRHLQTLSGEDISGTLTSTGTYNNFYYPTDVREISDSLDAGFSYTTSKKHWRYGFHARKTFAGSNTDSAFWLGAYVDIPFTIFKKSQ
jgi:hypothetical protein